MLLESQAGQLFGALLPRPEGGVRCTLQAACAVFEVAYWVQLDLRPDLKQVERPLLDRAA